MSTYPAGMFASDPLPELPVFAHEAMRALFRIRMPGTDEAVARGLARECFEHLDYLESRLSRFLEGSDVWRINRLQAGETVYISEACHACLLLGLEIHAASGGLFDIALGRQIEHRKSGADGPVPVLEGGWVVHPDVPAVTCIEPGREIDLGAVGKGYALDEFRRILADWGVESALLSAASSTLLAIGEVDWPVELSGDGCGCSVRLRNAALSASGTGEQGDHIVRPGGTGDPGYLGRRVWVVSPTAAASDAWSTAVLLMEESMVPGVMRGRDDLRAVWIERDGGIVAVPAC